MIMSKKAILVVSFGTTYRETREKTIDILERRVAEEFPGWEVRRAFTSKIVIKILKKRDGIHVDYITEGLERMATDGIRDAIVLTTHIINGIEYDLITSFVKERAGEFDSIRVSTPMLTAKEDYHQFIEGLKATYLKRCTGKDALVLMGHGTVHYANASYSQLQLELLSSGIFNVVITTVEGFPDFYSSLKLMSGMRFDKVYVAPLLLVAGDHATNDMAGDEDDSLKSVLEREGYSTECIIQGLGEHTVFQDIFIRHLREAMEREPVAKDSH